MPVKAAPPAAAQPRTWGSCVQMMRENWRWMRASTTFNTVIGQAGYSLSQAAATDCANWKVDGFRLYTTATGTSDEQCLTFLEYDDWRDRYEFGSIRSQTSRPQEITVKPDNSLAVGMAPNAVYTVVAEYFRNPTTLSADADDPTTNTNALPERFSMLLVYMVMMAYASYESAPEVAMRAAPEVRRLTCMLLRWGSPLPTLG